ncbi:MAG: hypothetical protein CMP51_04990 [Flavobacteriales bacterium]|nr:hypothetical protein [Flavobacteriales bacterium]|tara:strand:- start:1073 stop:1819 length:747 start_codon:yes stop_codon:yes gene_type:complete
MKLLRNIKDYILSYKYSRDDVFLVSFPKTGRSWLTYMLHNLDDYFLKMRSTHDLSEIIIENGFRQDPNLMFSNKNRFKFRRSKVIFLVRDPRDVVVSHFHQVTKRSKNPFIFESISEFVRDDILGFKRIIYFYNLWYNNKKIPSKFLLIKYEDLVNNGVSEIVKICEFVGLDIDIKKVQEVFKMSTADKMREMEKNNSLDGFRYFGNDINHLKVRKAKVGNYTNELNSSDIEFCNHILKDLVNYYNYS